MTPRRQSRNTKTGFFSPVPASVWPMAAAVLAAVVGVTAGCARSEVPEPPLPHERLQTPTGSRPAPPGQSTPSTTSSSPSASSAPGTAPRLRGRSYPWHTGIIATTFWVGEVFDPGRSDGSQRISTYDEQWLAHYGGCDGVVTAGRCDTECRTATNGYFPTRMTPRQNPFYLDLPYDDVNDPVGFARRGSTVPWAQDPGYAGRAADRSVSFMKGRWVRLRRGDRVCYGQIEDAGPGQYHDIGYVFGSDDRRPANREFNNAGLDVSPALNGCLDFSELNGENDRVDWQFVDDVDVPAGPWLILPNPPTKVEPFATPGQRP